MPKDKTASYERIVPAAMTEFLEKGFEMASMRSIASSIGMTSAALYRHFADKEAMFSALVQPALNEVEAQAAVMERDYSSLASDNIEAMWNSGTHTDLAQAFLKDAPVLVLDEASANLDSENERMINEAVNYLRKGRAALVP